MAAYTDDWTSVPFFGKEIKDGPGGNTIGWLTNLGAVTNNDPLGPSISAPGMDSAGNIWFFGACRFPGVDPQDPQDDTYSTGLLRAVYEPVNFKYELEVIFLVGQVFPGLNSTRDYQIRFSAIADSNSVDSATLWSGNVMQTPFNQTSGVSADPQSAASLGGLVFAAEIVYDAGTPGDPGAGPDGSFDKVTGTGGTANSFDQEYNVLFYVTGTEEGPSCCPCPGDLDPGYPNCDDIVDLTDFTVFASAYNTVLGDPTYNECADLDPPGGDGVVDLTDFTVFAAQYNNPCP
jgi:hypothetical protein